MSERRMLSARLREQYDQLQAAGEAVPQDLLIEVLSWVSEAENYERTLKETQDNRETLRQSYVQLKKERNFFQEEVFKVQKALKELIANVAVIMPKEDQ